MLKDKVKDKEGHGFNEEFSGYYTKTLSLDDV